jgi:uncharacterized RDD family membrane protein YckC
MKYANFWKRLLANTIDSFILSISLLPINLLLTFLAALLLLALAPNTVTEPAPSTDGQSTALEAIANLISLAVQIFFGWLYFAIMESSPKQATLGKQAMGIFVTDLHGKKISFGKATGRYFGKGISTLIFGIGYLMAAFTDKKQALHDLMAGTLVIRK